MHVLEDIVLFFPASKHLSNKKTRGTAMHRRRDDDKKDSHMDDALDDVVVTPEGGLVQGGAEGKWLAAVRVGARPDQQHALERTVHRVLAELLVGSLRHRRLGLGQVARDHAGGAAE